MSMQAESLEVLENASVAPAQARAIVRAIEISGAKDTLATKNDLVVLRAELRGEMAALGAELRTEIAKLGGELRAEIGGVARQMYVALLGQTAVLLGFFYFFLVQLRA